LVIFSDDRRAGARRHPVAGDGPHASCSVVAVVDVVLLVVDVELLVLELLVLVEVVVDVVVLLVVPPISQCEPEIPAGQMQTNVAESVARHVPPLRHVFAVHGSLGSVVVVVVPAVHAEAPSGADVPGGHGVHAVAEPVENVFAGQARHAAAPAAAA
jgi:hypothetical protein